MTELASLKASVVNSWRILKDDSQPKATRELAYREVVGLNTEIRKLDKNFSVNEIILGKYIEFKGDTPSPERKVKWAEAKVNTVIQKEYNHFVATAVSIVSERHPDLDKDTDKFGTIVNATVANLISLSKK